MGKEEAQILFVFHTRGILVSLHFLPKALVYLSSICFCRRIITIVSHIKNDILQLQEEVALYRDPRAYKQLYLHFYHSLIPFAASILKSREAAEEVFSDVMMKVWSMGGDLQKIDNLKVYLFASVKNASLNYLAKYHKVSLVDIDSVCLDSYHYFNIESSFYEKEVNFQVAKAVSTLPSKCQLVFRLIKEEGFTYKQVAEIMQISVNTVEGHMAAALKKMHYALKEVLSA